MCGEHDLAYSRAVYGQGSSPRVRGTLWALQLADRKRGIIPACAGNTYGSTYEQAAVGDHPRVCGEHTGIIRRLRIGEGSSPRVRGTPPVVPPAVGRIGIIPACAGNTAGVTVLTRLCGDHPRVCGEHIDKAANMLADRGSSPRVRGTQWCAELHRDEDGIIPACAGNTATRWRTSYGNEDHPRVCGEHDVPVVGTWVGGGSSPRVRGTPHGLLCLGEIHRIIPACAGNTV